MWDLESGAELATLSGHTRRVNAVAVTPDGRRAVSGSDGQHAEGVGPGVAAKRASCATLRGHRSAVSAVAVTPDGRRAVSGSRDKTLRVWDLESGAELATLYGHSDWVRAVAVTPDGRRAVRGRATKR